MAQIKISDDIYKELKEMADDNDRTLGGQIKHLMKIKKKSQPDENWVESNPPRKATKLSCCLADTPCKHWLWDMNTGEGYINALTGEVREV